VAHRNSAPRNALDSHENLPLVNVKVNGPIIDTILPWFIGNIAEAILRWMLKELVMKRLTSLVAAAAALIISDLPDSSESQAASGVKIGSLNCTVAGGVGLILGSSKGLNCIFHPVSGEPEDYTGSISKLGIDIGVTGETYIAWAVFAPGRLEPGSLAGSYSGATAEASLGLGLGANVLIGGSRKSIALQPLSVQGQTGLNIAAGVARIDLDYVGP
jgi:hypothetical protein